MQNLKNLALVDFCHGCRLPSGPRNSLKTAQTRRTSWASSGGTSGAWADFENRWPCPSRVPAGPASTGEDAGPGTDGTRPAAVVTRGTDPSRSGYYATP